MTLYVEGGGDTKALRTACRKGFTEFISSAGISKLPKVVACGSRENAFSSFCTAIANGQAAMLLVDSEVAVIDQEGAPTDWRPWLHLKQRQGDGWDKPTGCTNADCHLMVQCMENWFLADRASLTTFFGQDFQPSKLPADTNGIESIAKADVYARLKLATRDCNTKGTYDKGGHSFKLLATIDPRKVMSASPWAKRFVEAVASKMNAGSS